jgi:hypothetical protein
MRRLIIAALAVLVPAAAMAAMISEGGRRVILFGVKVAPPVSSGNILQVDGTSLMLLVDGTTIMTRTN